MRRFFDTTPPSPQILPTVYREPDDTLPIGLTLRDGGWIVAGLLRVIFAAGVRSCLATSACDDAFFSGFVSICHELFVSRAFKTLKRLRDKSDNQHLRGVLTNVLVAKMF